MKACRVCGARISKYAPPNATYCALHEPDPSVEDIIATLAPIEPGYCKRGHNLDETGFYANTGNGRKSRKCRACHTLRQRAYRQRSIA